MDNILDNCNKSTIPILNFFNFFGGNTFRKGGIKADKFIYTFVIIIISAKLKELADVCMEYEELKLVETIHRNVLSKCGA